MHVEWFLHITATSAGTGKQWALSKQTNKQANKEKPFKLHKLQMCN